MPNPLPLMSVSNEPSILVLSCDDSTASDVVSGWADIGLTTRTVRGSKMPDVLRLFDEMAAALQFPTYFGENWDAFNECMAEIDGLPFGNGFVVVFRDAERVLSDEPISELRKLVEVLARAHSTYSHPVIDGQWWDRAAVPFHAVLQTTEFELSAMTDRWRAAGASLVPLPD